MHQPKQLQLFEILIQPEIKAIYDPYWDELEAQKEDTVEQVLLSINAESETFNVDTLIAPQQNTSVRAQISFDAPPYKSVRAQVDYDTAPEHNYPESSVNPYTSNSYTHWVEKYWVKRRGEKHDYYRYCWMEGRKKYRCHIAGRAGRIGAIQRKEVVIEALADGQSPQEIKQLIRGFSNGNG
ncbi:hypothetical protein H6G81_35085 [Scytonema hofmannii FACHB-248]|uniref:CpcD n=1 Tax=Scytonema hofmannii FACHB-248 TaxID=1842502 RepID=A0ABR8H2B2_9CYAN|nr:MULTISPECIES: hypothetical protein [Nostocales]MBD2609577.1 hypothetical protein [Scytonema hofmannii FACHB-248]